MFQRGTFLFQINLHNRSTHARSLIINSRISVENDSLSYVYQSYANTCNDFIIVHLIKLKLKKIKLYTLLTLTDA